MSTKSGAKGFDLEEALRAYFWQAGYFVVRGVPYRLDGEDITDIDLWLYERPTAATRRRLIVDIKNRKSPRATERVIWTKGLQAALNVDGAIVATTDRRPSTRRLAKALNVFLLDGEALVRIGESKQLKEVGNLRSEAINEKLKSIDEARRTTDWRRNAEDATSSLISGIGALSLNRSLSSASFFAEQSLTAHPGSSTAEIAVRMIYHCAALVSISLDYILADFTFRGAADRRSSIANSIRFGDPEATAPLSTIRAAIGLARKYTDNGSAISKQIEYGFFNEAEQIPAEIIADYVMRPSTFNGLFGVARELEWASSSASLLSYDSLSTGAKSLVGVILDFNSMPREQVASAWSRQHEAAESPIFREESSSIATALHEEKNSVASAEADSDGDHRS